MTVPGRRDPLARATRRTELLDAADRAVRSAGPEVAMRTIAAAAGITKPILYRYFGDKRGLYRALAQRYVGPLVAGVHRALRVPAEPQQRIAAAIDAYLSFISSEPQVYRFLVHRAFGEQPEAQSTVAAALRQLGSEVALALGEAFKLDERGGAVAEALGQAAVGMVHAAGDWWLEDRSLPREDLVSHLTALLWGGLGSLDARRPAVAAD